LVEKFPTILEKLPQVRRGDFFLLALYNPQYFQKHLPVKQKVAAAERGGVGVGA